MLLEYQMRVCFELSENIDKYVQKKDANGDGFIDQDERKRKFVNGSHAGKKAQKPKG